MKKIFLIVALIFSLFSLSGCSKSHEIDDFIAQDFVMLSIDFSSSGQITQSFDFSVNSDRYKETTKQEEIFTFKANLIEELSEIRNEFLLSFALMYIANPNEIYKINTGVILSQVVYNQEFDTVGFNIAFTSLCAWQYYHPSTQSLDSQADAKGGNLFINKQTSLGVFPFSSSVTMSEDESKLLIGERYYQKYLNAASGLSFKEKLKEEYKPTFIYNYSVYNSKLHSDAHFQYKDNGHYHHIWAIEKDKLTEDNKICLYSYSVNYGMWYLFAIILTLVIMLIILLVYKYKKKNEK